MFKNGLVSTRGALGAHYRGRF